MIKHTLNGYCSFIHFTLKFNKIALSKSNRYYAHNNVTKKTLGSNFLVLKAFLLRLVSVALYDSKAFVMPAHVSVKLMNRCEIIGF